MMSAATESEKDAYIAELHDQVKSLEKAYKEQHEDFDRREKIWFEENKKLESAVQYESECIEAAKNRIAELEDACETLKRYLAKEMKVMHDVDKDFDKFKTIAEELISPELLMEKDARIDALEAAAESATVELLAFQEKLNIAEYQLAFLQNAVAEPLAWIEKLLKLHESTEHAEVMRDANRYRFLRNYEVSSYMAFGTGVSLDSQIDAAIAEGGVC